MDAYLAEFQSQSSPHAHAGPEFIYAMSGQVVVTVDGSDSRLEQGDAMYFNSSFPHSFTARRVRALCSALGGSSPESNRLSQRNSASRELNCLKNLPIPLTVRAKQQHVVV